MIVETMSYTEIATCFRKELVKYLPKEPKFCIFGTYTLKDGLYAVMLGGMKDSEVDIFIPHFIALINVKGDFLVSI